MVEDKGVTAPIPVTTTLLFCVIVLDFFKNEGLS
jgi:hypothetical protein